MYFHLLRSKFWNVSPLVTCDVHCSKTIICRQGSDGVSIDDVFEFSNEQMLLRSRTKGTSVFARQEWDEYVFGKEQWKFWLFDMDHHSYWWLYLFLLQYGCGFSTPFNNCTFSWTKNFPLLVQITCFQRGKKQFCLPKRSYPCFPQQWYTFCVRDISRGCKKKNIEKICLITCLVLNECSFCRLLKFYQILVKERIWWMVWVRGYDFFRQLKYSFFHW